MKALPIFTQSATAAGEVPRPMARNAYQLLALTAAAAALASYGSKTRAEPLTGGVGAAYSTPEAVNVNPANAAFLDRTQIGMSAPLFHSNSFQIRYPGYDTVSDNDSGVDMPFGLPSLVFKVSPRFGIAGFVAPPLPFDIVTIDKQKIPLMVLGELNFVDITGAARLDGFASIAAGYRFTDTFGLGFRANYYAVSFEAVAKPSEGGPAIFDIRGKMTGMTAGIGVRYDAIPGRLSVGAASDIVSVTQTSTTTKVVLQGETTDDDGAKPALVNPLESIVVGAQFATSPQLRLLTDFKYTRAKQGEKAFSIVELKEKQKDVHDTLAVKAGSIIGISGNTKALAGFAYEPASLGAGSVGNDEDEGLLGFGTQDVIMIMLDAPLVSEDLKPYWLAALGMQWGFSPQAIRVAKGSGQVRTAYYNAWTVATGLVYRRASLGIDGEGEQPGAYLQTSTTIPIQVIYKF